MAVSGQRGDRVSPVILRAINFSAPTGSISNSICGDSRCDCDTLEWTTVQHDPDSLIDLTRVAILRLSRTCVFANSGFPFTRLADLSDTAFVLRRRRQRRSAGVPESVGKDCDATGLPATRYAVVSAEHVDTVAIAISSSRARFFPAVAAPVGILQLRSHHQHRRHTAPKRNFLQRLIHHSIRDATIRQRRRARQASLGKPYSYMSSFWSPLDVIASS